MTTEEEMLKKLYHDDGMTQVQIAQKLGWSQGKVSYKIRGYGLTIDNSIPRSILVDMYCNKKMSIDYIAHELGCSSCRVHNHIKKYKIETRPKGTNQTGTPHTLDDARRIFAEYGHTLLEEEYVNVNTPMRFRCKCGNISKIRLMVVLRGGTCTKCAAKRISRKLRLEYEDVRETFEERGCVLLSKEYVNGNTHLEYICTCGAKAEMTFNNFKRGYGCRNCKSLKFRGENNHNWNPDLTDEERLQLGRYEEQYGMWRTNVFRKHSYACDVCGGSKSNTLCAHHLDGYAEHPDKRTDVDNGVCMCEDCHVEFHKLYGFGGNTKEQYLEFKSEHA